MSLGETPESRSLLPAALAVEGGLVLVALAAGWLFGLAPLEQIKWTAAGLTWGLLAAVPMLVGLVVMDRYPIGPLADLDRVVRESIVPLFRDASLGELLVISVLAGLGEEMLFRGVVQVGFARLLDSPWIGVAIASIVFGIAHPITATYAVIAGAIGVYFGALLLATDNLLVPIVTHAAYDFAALVYLVRSLPREK